MHRFDTPIRNTSREKIVQDFAGWLLQPGTAFILTITTCCLFAAVISTAHAAAPDDINTDQRAWYDAVDLNADGVYTDNPSNNTSVQLWRDKSGAANDISTSGSSQPRYQHNSPVTNRHGVKFDGIDDHLRDNNDIWIGSVDSAEIFIVATTDGVRNSSLFSSTDRSRNRLSTHAPWGDNVTFFDHGFCCGAPARLFGNANIVLSTPYTWHFIGLPALQAVVRDGITLLNDTGAGTYTTTTDSAFVLAGWPFANLPHNGSVYEAVFYQRGLNTAQRRILTSYLSAKWERSFASGATITDVYAGDEGANGDYDFFVGGIGQDNGQQTSGTSQGLTITDETFLSADGEFIVAGVDYLITAPTTGTTTNDLPPNYIDRSNRTWYLDKSDNGANTGTVNLTFNAAEIGIPVVNGQPYGLLYRSGTVGSFTEVSTSLMSSGSVTFSHLPSDGIYSIGKIQNEVTLSIVKGVSDERPNIGDVITFTLTLENAGPAVATNASVADVLPAGLGNPLVVANPPGTVFTINGNLLDWSGITIPAGGSVSATYTAVVLAP